MSRRLTGVIFCGIAAMLYAARYLTAAVYGSGQSNTWSAQLFTALLGYVSNNLTVAAIVALVAGVAYLVWAEVAPDRR